MALASRHAAPSPFLHRAGGFDRPPGKNHVAVARTAKALVIRAKKLESTPSSSSSTSSPGKISKKPATTDQSPAPPAPNSSSSTPSPNDEYFDPGMVPDFWEGEQWNWLGFIIQYLWAIGIVVAVITCGILFVTYKPRQSDYIYREPPTLEEVRKILDERKNTPSLQAEEQEQAPVVAEKEPEIKAEVVEPEIKSEIKAEVEEPEMESEVVEATTN